MIRNTNVEIGNFCYKGNHIHVRGMDILFLRDDSEFSWGIRCPICRKRFVVGDDCRVMHPRNGQPFEINQITGDKKTPSFDLFEMIRGE